MANPEFRKTLEQLDSVKLSRREVMKYGIFAVAGLIGATGVAVDMVRALSESYKFNNLVITTYPLTEDISKGEEDYQRIQRKIINLVRQDKVDTAKQLIASEDFMRSSTFHAKMDILLQSRRELRDQLNRSGNSFVMKSYGATVLLEFVFIPLAILSFTKCIAAKAVPKKLVEKAQNKLTALRPDWLDHPASAREVIALDRASSYLPPIGGKLPIQDTENRSNKEAEAPDRLDPSYVAEEQSQKVIGYRREGALGKFYVHQLAVQGRLPDRFKYAALALICHSPYKSDWTQPFFKAEWAKVAPLVHDGGIVIRNFNPRWRGVEGRTDFLQRIFLIQEPELNILEQKSPAELVHVSVDRLTAARADQLEEERLRLESRFYQRAAFALHAAIGTAPRSIPKDIRFTAADTWNDFEEQMKNLLVEYTNGEIGNAVWFLDKPRAIKGWERYGGRQEAEWPPIQQELIRLEEKRKHHPGIILKVRQLLIQTTETIDQILGLKA